MSATFTDYRARAPKLNAFRDCFEAGMDFDTALGCAGLTDSKPEFIAVLHRFWSGLEARAA